jgi:hypothetical protein
VAELGRLDELARAMHAEANKLAAAGSGAAEIARDHLDRMLEKARALAASGALSPSDLAALRRELGKLAGECSWQLAGLGNRNSWAFGKVVEALRTASRATAPILELAGIAAPNAQPDPDALAAAFGRLDRAFRGASADMARAVEGELVRMVTAGAEPKEIARRLVADNVVDPVAGMTPEVRAETIARTETMRVYRQAVRSRARQAPGLTHWRMVGPVTQRTSMLCRSLVGRTLAEGDWRTIMGERWDGDHAGRGLHPNCRHSWQPVRPEWLELSADDASRTGPWNNELAVEHDADTSLPAYSMDELRNMPEPERRELFSRSEHGFRLRGAA